MSKYKNEDCYSHGFFLENGNEKFAHFVCEYLEDLFIPIETDFNFLDEDIEEDYIICIWILKSFEGDEQQLINEVWSCYIGLAESFDWCKENLSLG